MTVINYTLVSEGPSDQALIPIIDWLFRAQGSEIAVNGTWADRDKLPRHTTSLADKIRFGLDFFPCDVLFVHRDSDEEAPEKRRAEIEAAMAGIRNIRTPFVCVIPVKTMEAWFLFSEQAIREFVGNPGGKADLNLPSLNRIEATSRPKERLNAAFEAAGKAEGRRKKSYNTTASLVAFAREFTDFSPLQHLDAFSRLEADIRAVLEVMDARK